MDASNKPELLIVTGMSGAGRSTTGNGRLSGRGWRQRIYVSKTNGRGSRGDIEVLSL